MTGYARALTRQIDTIKATLAAMYRDMDDYELRIRTQERIREKMGEAYTISTDLIRPLNTVIAEAIVAALNATQGNKMKAAKLLGINVKTLYNHIRRSHVRFHTNEDNENIKLKKAITDAAT